MAIDNNDPNAGTLRNDLFSAYQTYSDSLMNANIDNPVGASLFMGKAYDMSISEIEKTLNDHPSLKTYSSIQKQLTSKKVAEETGEGKPYKDFEVPYEGKTQTLSSLMKPGHYTLLGKLVRTMSPRDSCDQGDSRRIWPQRARCSRCCSMGPGPRDTQSYGRA